jgi:hypothetical protein
MVAIVKMAIVKISMFSDFNENLYVGLFWSEELIGNDENCIQGHFYFQNVYRKKIGKILMFSDYNENWYVGLFWSEELIGIDENCIQGHFYFQNCCQQNRQNFNVLWFQWKLISTLGLFWSEELIGNDENCIQGNFYDASISKKAANKIGKLLMVSDFNENWYLGVFWSEE